MKQILKTLFVVLFCVMFGTEALTAKEKESTEVAVFTLSPAPVCQNCVNKIKNNLRFEKGVKEINVNLTTKRVILQYSPKSTNSENLVKALKKIGYTATPYKDETSEKSDADKE